MIVKLLRGFGHLWATLVGVAILLGFIGTWWKQGFFAAVSMMSPFNLWNWLVTILLLLPAFGALMLADWLESKKSDSGTRSG